MKWPWPVVACVLVLADTSLAAEDLDLTGTWRWHDGGTASVRQVGNEVWWILKSPDDGKSWTTVFHGKLNGMRLTGQYADVPEGKNRLQGNLTAKLILNDGKIVRMEGEAIRSPSNERVEFSLSRIKPK
jgi:hypothetical protein